MSFLKSSRGALSSSNDGHFESLQAFLDEVEGKHLIEKILISNNGNAAVKFMQSVRRWSYEVFGNDKIIHFVSMATPEDITSNSEFVRMADAYIPVPGGSNNNNYANVDLIVEIAERIGADAVWPGWGHASEYPKLPEMLKKRGIIFIGPPANSMRSLGDKISSSILAQSVEVNSLPWNGSDIKLDVSGVKPGEVIDIPPEVYAQGLVTNVNDGLAASEKIGYPVMIKASEGGGGKGIRKVEHKEDFAAQFNQVQAEVAGSPIFVMKLAENVRHIEVQLLADTYGDAVALFTRDCSVQRRHQKILEEAPASVGTREQFRVLEQAAVRLAKIVGYQNVGTVEYLFTETGEYYFLELNPRLQVEHPCTEMVTDINLPATQVLVAMGVPLHRMPDIRGFYGLERYGTSKIDFEQPEYDPVPKGHVIAARITAENPDEGFKPTSGHIQELNFRSIKNVWGYFSVAAGGKIHEFADSQFGHIFAWGENRDQARRNLVVALKNLTIRGEIRTSVEYLVTLLETDAFSGNMISTAWLDALIAQKMQSDKPDIITAVICTSLFISGSSIDYNMNQYRSALERGQVLGSGSLDCSSSAELIYDNVRYLTRTTTSGSDKYVVELNGTYVEVVMHKLLDGGRLISFGGQSIVTYVKEEYDKYRVELNGKTISFMKEDDPSYLRTTSPGKLIRYLVEDGSYLAKGVAYAEVEVMKMLFSLLTPESGIIHFNKIQGSVLESGDIIAKLDLEDTSKIQQIYTYENGFPEFSVSHRSSKVNHIFEESYQFFANGLKGYSLPAELFASKLKTHTTNLFRALKDNSLPITQLNSILASLKGRIPEEVDAEIEKILEEYKDQMGSVFCMFPAQQISQVISSHVSDNDNFHIVIEPVQELLKLYENGLRGYEKLVVSHLLKIYLETEELFGTQHDDKQIIIDLASEDKDKAFEVAFAHYASKTRTQTAVALLNFWSNSNDLNDDEKELISRLASLSNRRAAEVAIKARKIVMQNQIPSFEKRKLDMEIAITESLKSISMLQDMVSDQHTLFDVLSTFFFHSSQDVRLASVEIYLRRAYAAYTIKGISNLLLPGTGRLITKWNVLPPQQAENNTLLRTGLLAVFQSLSEAGENIHELVEHFTVVDTNQNIVQIVFQLNYMETKTEEQVDELLLAELNEFAQTHGDLLSSKGVKRVTFMVVQNKSLPIYYTYRKSSGWQEDRTYRYLEPGLAYQLELYRLQSYDKVSFYPTGNRKQNLYYCENADGERRFFIRSIIHNCDIPSEEESQEYWVIEAEQQILDSISALELVSRDTNLGATDCNHIFLNFLPVMKLDLNAVKRSIWKIVGKHGYQLWKLRVNEAEVRLTVKPSEESEIMTVRWYIQNTTGYYQTNNFSLLREIIDEEGNLILVPMDKENDTSYETFTKVRSPYTPRSATQTRRFNAQRAGTVYVYDIPDLFKEAVIAQWRGRNFMDRPQVFMTSQELTLDENNNLVPVKREPGTNTIGMVAWELTLFTPEYPMGRDIILISNDITVQIGSFGVKEDQLFYEASKYARKRGIPRIYYSANSGARLGLAEEIKSSYKVAWIDGDISKGCDYLYLSEEDYQKYEDSVIVSPLVTEEGETRYVITDIIGLTDGIGVENLRGSGLIAGETSLAYDEIFTLTITSCRSVGIGAYLVRLGQRVIQLDQSYIILTGAEALNKLLGRKVYTSNNELGGTQIMHKNGVSHLTAPDDITGIGQIIKWLSYVPKDVKSSLPISQIIDPIDREVQVCPTEGLYDPRDLLAGRHEGTEWLSGFFDKGSFMETLTGWALAVISGRARLGGIPVGVLAVETRMTEIEIPADPGLIESKKQIIQKAGQVWTPDSSYKTSQAIMDINREGLPLIVFANWRGFSGGTQDMFDQVLKFGSYIVDALRDFKQPVMIYIPPFAELRGGSWVVVDPTINSDMMEMYADEQSKGGILEPQGIVEIKYRVKDIKTTMLRLDDKYRELVEQLNNGSDVNAQIVEYEKKHIPIYQQIAVSFAALHDTPGRMKAKNCVDGIIRWKESRTFFYWRLRRRLIEEELISTLTSASELNTKMERAEALATVKQVIEGPHTEEDSACAEWMTENKEQLLAQLQEIKHNHALSTLTKSLESNPTMAANLINQLLLTLDPETKKSINL
eukprot:TRINITY_DN2099_c0_g1_i1.p1 TRINITY_DN2099_c0_g1~~TRINITY_DN2099_c0_g1_i1.p1  ORF type:complete len:2139 (-),score=550.43 TRINITY_DN2099_c0_g1_i1:13-6429(-)